MCLKIMLKSAVIIAIVFVFSIFAISLGIIPVDAQTDNQVSIDVILEKNNFVYGELISLEIQVDPPVPNTPIIISLHHDDFYVDEKKGNYLISKDEDTQENTIFSTSIGNFKDYGYFEKYGIFQLTFSPKNVPDGTYLLTVNFGSNDVVLGTYSDKITITTNENSIGNQYLQKYFPTVPLDTGTSVKDHVSSDPVFLTWYGSSLNPCGNDFECKTYVSKTYTADYKGNTNFYEITLIEFETINDAKKYGALHYEWDNGGFGGERSVVINQSSINDEYKQCFEYDGGFYSANGARGFLKCTIGNLVVIGTSTDKISQSLVTSTINKLEQYFPLKTKTNEPVIVVQGSAPVPESVVESILESTSNQQDLASFVDATKDPQHYIDRYNNESTYKEWFDENYSQYSSIYEAVGLEEPLGIASFVDTSKDPQSYVDRYNNESTYKEWFDENYSQYSSIYEAVGLEEFTSEPIAEVTSTPNCGSGTELVNGICKVIQTEEKSSKGGGCLIATATYGSEMAPQVQQLRELRDNQLLNTESGTAFMGTFNDIYYSFSPIIADYERENPYFKEAVKLAITPMISTLSLMENAESESEVLGIGISVIMLNIGMYLAVPTVVIVGIRKKF
jgi:hypothetical protein